VGKPKRKTLLRKSGHRLEKDLKWILGGDDAVGWTALIFLGVWTSR
jgi:hypothetical protein